MDAINATSKTTGTLASPKVTKAKTATGTSILPQVLYGCDHVRALFKEAKKTAKDSYDEALRSIEQPYTVLAQTHKPLNADGRPIVSIRPTYLCLQCPRIFTPEVRDKHFEEKGHSFFVQSRSGYLYCANCADFVYDPELEKIRTQRGTKRKFDDLASTEDQRLVATQSAFVPCRATGLRGLYNMGQTCFMSVILQTLIHNPFMRNYYLGENHKSTECEKEHCMSCAMEEIFTEFYSTEKTEGYGAVPILMASWMAEQALVGYQQQDAHEYMQFLLNALHTDNGGDTEGASDDCSCIIHRIFYGMLQSTVTCDKCRNITTALDPVMDLSLDLRQAKKQKSDGDSKDKDKTPICLKDCLERFTGKEKLAAADYSCQNCGGTPQNATKQLSIKRLPPVVPIHFKRFEHTKSTSNKLETKVSFPLEIDLFPYTTRFKRNIKSQQVNGYVPLPQPSLIYGLTGVIVHKGKIDSGHYISYSREGSDWFLFDDNKAVTANEADVLSANAYLLFYTIKSLDQPRSQAEKAE